MPFGRMATTLHRRAGGFWLLLLLLVLLLLLLLLPLLLLLSLSLLSLLVFGCHFCSMVCFSTFCAWQLARRVTFDVHEFVWCCAPFFS